ncbi:hypothetical protein [Frankia sp. Cppng1_Ct_nod]|uniref:hypothetical protein n=1 Tax=Frankia sp. Cppng1_Ct_nod TaxID=2897162 RepID=UPI001041B1CD|nr:hypothetical protein [Frankia sp. Cppng1_Ct_nod]
MGGIVTSDMLTIYPRLAARWGWRMVLVSVLFWTLLWPVGTIWLLASLVIRRRAIDKSPDARTERRVERFLSWYPADWRARYGAEFSQLLRDTIGDGHGGVRLTLNVMREANAARVASTGGTAAAVCWSLCWIPLFPQGIVPLVVKLAGTPSRSWFLALYLPASYQWLVIAVMVGIGLTMLTTAVRITAMRTSE